VAFAPWLQNLARVGEFWELVESAMTSP